MSTKITNNVFGLNLMKYAARIKIWLLLECNVQLSRKLTLSSKFSDDNSFSEVGVDMRTRAPHKIWLMLERKARISGSPHHSSTPLHPLAANFANVKSQNSLPASVKEKNI